jgi:hypothetical protein
MPRMIDQIRASKLPSNMMQFAARGALQVPAAENIEILVHLALHNKVFGDLARMTLAGWDEKSCLAAASDPQTPREVLTYFVSPDNLRPKLLPALLENQSVPEGELIKLAVSALRETIDAMLGSERVRSMRGVLETLRTNPYLKKQEAEELAGRLRAGEISATAKTMPHAGSGAAPVSASLRETAAETTAEVISALESPEAASEADEQAVSAYLNEHAPEIAAEGSKPFQAIGGIVETLMDHASAAEVENAPAAPAAAAPAPSTPAATPAGAAAKPGAVSPKKPPTPGGPDRRNTLQKINALDVKGRIQLALKGNKEERSILIRDGTKVVALAVLEAPKLADGEVEKFASQKNVLEAVLRQIPLKRRFMKNYVIVRNLVANPRTPLDLGLGLMKNLLAQDLKNLSANKEVSETIRKLALKMYKQKMEDSNKKK